MSARDAGPASTVSDPAWPELPYAGWKDTCETLQMWTQVVGHVKLELCPFLNEWWEVAFEVTARGLTTLLIPWRDQAFEIRFDFIDHQLLVETSAGEVRRMALEPRSVAAFYREFTETLRSLEITVSIGTIPDEVAAGIPFDRDDVHASYDAEYVNRWWQILLQTAKVMQRYRASFAGKSSPIMFFWGSFDLTTTRFSGRRAPAPEGAPRFFQIAEDQENIACGFWPGNANAMGVEFGEPAFYAYAYPMPDGYSEAAVLPDSARFDGKLGEFILPYESVRTAAAPEDTLLQFFTSAYAAGADLGVWDRQFLDITAPRRKRRASP